MRTPRPHVRIGIVLFIFLAAAVPSAGGDYMLTISNDPTSSCGQVKSPPNPSWPVRTGSEVAASLTRHFSRADEAPGVVVAFANGHFRFCGRKERAEVYAALLDAAALETLHHERHLYDVAGVLASRQFIAALEHRLAAPGIRLSFRKRLERMRAEARESLSRITMR